MFSAGQPLSSLDSLLRALPEADVGVEIQLLQIGAPRDINTLNADAVGDVGTVSDGAAKLDTLIADLEVGVGDASVGAALTLGQQWEASFRQNMKAKKQRYANMASGMVKQIVDEQERLNQYNKIVRRSTEEWIYWDGDPSKRPDPGAGAAPGLKGALHPKYNYTSLPDNSESKWNLIKDTQANQWKGMITRYTAVNQLSSEAARRVPNRRKFTQALKKLKDYSTQSIMLTEIVQLVYAFIYSPEVANNMYVNMVIAGDPGTGKSRLALVIGNVLARLGLFIKEDMVEASSTDFRGQYLGETAQKTLTFLTSNLERVVFLDEAYALTTYDTTKSTGPRTLDQYSRRRSTR